MPKQTTSERSGPGDGRAVHGWLDGVGRTTISMAAPPPPGGAVDDHGRSQKRRDVQSETSFGQGDRRGPVESIVDQHAATDLGRGQLPYFEEADADIVGLVQL